MSGRERVFSVLSGKAPERRPFSALLSLYGARLIQCPLREFYADSKKYVQGQCAALETFGLDVIFAPFAMALFGEAFGGEAGYLEDQAPNLYRPAIPSAEHLDELKVPDVDSHPGLLFFREAIRGLKKSKGEEAALAAILPGPADLPILLMGLEAWLDTLLANPDGTRRTLDLTTPFFLKLARAFVEDGADALVLPAALMTRAVGSPGIVDEVALPVLRDALEELRAPVIVHHVGGRFRKYLDRVARLPFLAAVVLDPRDDPLEAKKILPEETAVVCGPDAGGLPAASPREVEDECRKLLEIFREEPRFILATTGADVPLETEPDRIHAMRKTVEAHEL